MSLELQKGLVTKLKSQTTAGARVHPILPQGITYPAIRYQHIESTRTQSLDGNVGVTAATLQVDCMAGNVSQAWTLADEVRTILHGYTGSWGALVARNVVLETDNLFYEQDGDRVTVWVSQRYRVYTDMD